MALEKMNLRTLAFYSILLLASPGYLYADTPAYSTENAREYFSDKTLALVMRLDGGPPLSEYLLYSSMFSGSDYNEEESIETWLENFEETVVAKFLVIRTIQGSLEQTVDIYIEDLQRFDFPLGEPVVAFVTESPNEDYLRTWPLESFIASEGRQRGIEFNFESIVEFLIRRNVTN